MMQGILLHCHEGATQEMIDMLVSFAHDKVINNKICLARLMQICKSKNKNFDWM